MPVREMFILIGLMIFIWVPYGLQLYDAATATALTGAILALSVWGYWYQKRKNL